jgi:hypothetical protein
VGTTRKRTAGTGTVIARGNGTFTAQISDGGRRSIGTFGTRAAAEKALAIVLVEGPPPALDLTFGTYLTEWLVDQAFQVKATTAARNRTVIRQWVLGRSIAAEGPRPAARAPPGARSGARRARAPRWWPSEASLHRHPRSVLRSAIQRLVDDRVCGGIPRRAAR